MTDDNQLNFKLPSVSRKKVTAAFDGGRLSSDGGVMLLALVDRRRKVADTLAAYIADRRDPSHITHTVADVLRARMLAIGCGYPDGNDFDWLRRDAAFKLACGRLPDTGRDLCSQPTISRWENAPTPREIICLTYALVDIWCRSYRKPPKSVVLDIDDTVDVVHGHQPLAQWNAHYDERCYLPIHVYDTDTGRPVVVILRPGKTPSGVEVRKLLSRLVGRIRRHWPDTHIIFRGDGHYGREEAMTWCEANGVDYIFGLPGNVVLDRLVEPVADDIRVRRAESQAEVLRGFAETRYAAKSWNQERRVVARIEASASHEHDILRRGIDIRYIVTSVREHEPEHLYETVYCARGQAENLIKQHKAQLASDRTSCRSPFANQMRLISAYRRLLAAARCARRDTEMASATVHRVRYHPFASVENRRTHYRDREPHSHRARLMLPRGRDVQPHGIRTPVVTRHRKYAETRDGVPAGFATPSRRIELYSEEMLDRGYSPLPEFDEPRVSPRSCRDLTERFPLILTSAKDTHFCETQHRNIPSLRRRAPDPQVELHPDLAAARGIRAGDWVRISTPAGSVRARARLNDALHKDVVCGQHGRWDLCEEIGAPGYDPYGPDGANLNLLIDRRAVDPVSGTAPHRSFMCQVAPA